MSGHPFDPARAESGHILALAADVPPEELEVLAASRFVAAAWEDGPGVPAARRGRGKGQPLSTLRLSRHSDLSGPYLLDRTTGAELGLPRAAAQAWVLRAPVERGEEPWLAAGDRDGLGRAFPAGLPVREEARVVSWLVAAARRLGGAVRIAPGPTGTPAVLVPDPAGAVDLTLWSDIWLEPEAALVVVRHAVPRAGLDLGTPWHGPPAGTGALPVPGAEDLDPRERKSLHEAADRRDLEVLAAPEPLSAYGVLADLDMDGMLAVQIAGETEIPQALVGVPWASAGAVAYRVTWEPDDLGELEAERPSMAHRVARGRATPLLNAIARSLHAAVGGEITDTMGFIVDPADL